MKQLSYRRVALCFMVVLASFSLAGCSLFHGNKSNLKPPAALVAFRPAVKVQRIWSTSSGTSSKGLAIKLVPAVGDGMIVVAGANGEVVAINETNGRRMWHISTRTAITAGPSIKDGLIVVGTANGVVIGINGRNGAPVWNTSVDNEILATPTIQDNIVFVKTIDGQLTALAAHDGHTLWTYQQTSPLLTLRGGSAAAVANGKVVAGFADGKLAVLSERSGNLLWGRVLAIPKGSSQVDELVDIVADPVIRNGIIYAATYQGNVAALGLNSGQVFWQHSISSYAGLTVGHRQLFVSDADSYVWAFDRQSGGVNWRQTDLDSRRITGPVIQNGLVVVGDEEGFLHWMAPEDGHFVARALVGNSGIRATPVIDNGVLYALTLHGQLAAYRVKD